MCSAVKLISVAAWFLATMGFMLISYGLLRQSFTDLSEKRGFGEGRYGEGPYGGGLTVVQRWLVSFGKFARLLSSDESLTLTDRKKNAAVAIAGVISVASSFGLDLLSRICF